MLKHLLIGLALVTGISAELHELAKRQNATFTIHRPDNGSDSLTSRMPPPCISGCFKVSGYYQGCLELGSTVEPCTWLCGARNYTTWVQCLNCVVANGEQDVTSEDIGMVLQNTNGYCSGASGFAATSAITATPTTTGPFESDFTVASTATDEYVDLTFPTWTGLATLADQNFYSDLNSELDAEKSADGPVVIVGSSTRTLIQGPTIGQETSTSMVQGPTNGQVSGGEAPTTSAAATTSGATTKAVGGVKMGGLAGMILGVVLA